MIQIDRDICQKVELASAREWLETNGLGGFASSTICGLNTRRYHGLLVAALKPPVGRTVLLSKLEEVVILNGNRYEISSNQYNAAIHPHGYRYLIGFRLDPFPVFTYQMDGLTIEKSIFMVHGENSTLIRYDIIGESSGKVELELRPLIAFRDYHSMTHENSSLKPEYREEKALIALQPYPDQPALYLSHDATSIEQQGHWYRNFEYAVEKERGLDFSEDLFCPVSFYFDLSVRSHATVIASTEPHHVAHYNEHKKTEIERRKSIHSAAPFQGDGELVPLLVSASDQYIVNRGEEKSVIAGYHWFSDWGRDTMISLPGLTLVTGRPDIAQSIFLSFIRHIDQGMLPNRFPDAGEHPEYNTVDATLWFFEAIRSFLQHSEDYDFVRTNLYESLCDICDWHVRGTRYGIRLDQDGLLLSGEPGVQLTWMDAKVGDWVVTPRYGKAVEIQALWYNALKILEHLAVRFVDIKRRKLCREIASRAAQSFESLFWNESAECLYDVVMENEKDGSIRPNQIFAVSLKYPLLSGAKAKKVVAIVEKELFTPFGLRSLSPSDPKYRGRYEGGPRERDGSYHQGAVWGWLLGPFITAYLQVHNHTVTAKRKAASWLEPIREHVSVAGIGQISEIFEGDPPHRPVGCIAQAWSVAEILRAISEDIGSDLVP